jgi:hypothetical protein
MSIIRTVVVTTTQTIKIEIDDKFATDEYLDDWRRGLWHIDGVDDVVKHAAEMVAAKMDGCNLDGIGLLGRSDSTYPRVPDTKFEIIDEEVESELVEQ